MIVYMLELNDIYSPEPVGRPELFETPLKAGQRALELFAYPGNEAELDGSPLWAMCTDWNGQEELKVEHGDICITLSPAVVQ